MLLQARPLGSFRLLILSCCLLASNGTRAGLWVTGYYPGYEQSSMDVSNVDLGVVTHVIHFALTVNTDGSLDPTTLGVTASGSSNVITRAHASGRKALICAGGAGSETGFQGATSAANLPTFVNNLTNFMAARGYDGIDLDWEPLAVSDSVQFSNLVVSLRAALNSFSSPRLLTAAIAPLPQYGDPALPYYQLFSALQGQFDQMNLMTYDLAGPYEGWVTWFNSPIYNGGYVFPGTSELIPCIDLSVTAFLTNGVSPGKIGVGTAFYGYIWSGSGGFWQPRQSWPNTAAPTTTAESYSTIYSTYFQTNLYHWDSVAQAAWLGITNSAPANEKFISFDDERSSQAKVSYALSRHLGGVMIWELAQDYFPSNPPGQRNVLLQAIKQAVAAPGAVSVKSASNNLLLSFQGMPLGSYTVQWTTNLAGNFWNTLLVTNLAGPAETLTITDAVSSATQRFYRVHFP